MIGQKGIPAKSGGIEKHVEGLALELKRQGHEVIVYTRPYYISKNIKKFSGINLINIPSLKTKHFDAASHTLLATLHAIFKIKDLDIIHYHGIGPSLFIPLARILKPTAKIISTFHCQDYYHQKWSLMARLFLRLGEFSSVYFPHKTIVVSKTLKKYVNQKYHRSVTYIPNAVQLGNDKISNKKTLKILKKWELKPSEYIITVNRLVRHKGIHTLIKAFKKLDSETQKKRKLVIVGDPVFTEDYEKEIKALAKNNKNIIFAGQQTGESLGALFANAYIYVHPSESEGLSLSLLEALSHKLPLLVSDIPANMEVIKGLGFCFKNKDQESLYQQLSYMLSLPENKLKKIGLLGQKMVTNDYNWEVVAKKTEKIYKKTRLCFQPRILFRFKTKEA
ncbi:MAG: glycosyltransferase family 4 protein [Candidatus Paceibacterota bacterium]